MYKEMIYPYIVGEAGTVAIPLATIKRYLKLPALAEEDLDADLSLMCKTALEYAEKYTRQIFQVREITTNRVFWGEFRNGILQEYFTLRRTPVRLTSL